MKHAFRLKPTCKWVRKARIGEAHLTGFDLTVDTGRRSLVSGPDIAAQASGSSVDLPRVTANFAAGVRVPIGDATLQAGSSLLTVDGELTCGASLQDASSLVDASVVVEADEGGGADLSGVVVTRFELPGFSLTMEDPPLLWSCNSGSPPFHSDFAGEVVELTPIPLGLSNAMFEDWFAVSLTNLGRLGSLNIFGGLCQFVDSFISLERGVAGGQ